MDDLPIELKIKILEYLDINEIVNLFEKNKEIKKFCLNDDILSKKIHKFQFKKISKQLHDYKKKDHYFTTGGLMEIIPIGVSDYKKLGMEFLEYDILFKKNFVKRKKI